MADYRLEGVRFYRKNHRKARFLRAIIRAHERASRHILNGEPLKWN